MKRLFTDYDLNPFLDASCDPVERYILLAKAAEYVFQNTEELSSNEEKDNGKKVSFKTYFLQTVKRMRMARMRIVMARMMVIRKRMIIERKRMVRMMVRMIRVVRMMVIRMRMASGIWERM